MNDALSLNEVYKGWDEFQETLVAAVAPLSNEQLDLRAAPHLRSIGEIASHIVFARALWFHSIGLGGKETGQYETWNQESHPVMEIASGLKATWKLIHDALQIWTILDLTQEVKSSFRGKTYLVSRQFVVYHVMEHDLHHGGEFMLTLGIHHLGTPPVGPVRGHTREA